MTVAELRQVSKSFGAVRALDEVSLTIEPGETVALLGPNGAGKSTVAAVLVGLRAPDAGRALVDGRDPRDHRARTALGTVPQETMLPQTLRVRELVAFAARHFPAPDPVGASLARFGLSELAERQAGSLSVGQRRRLGLALAFVGRPRLLVLDEPTAPLDGEGRAAVWDAVAAAREGGAAALVTTHHLDEAEAVATRVVALEGGRVVAHGSVDEVRRRAGGARIRFRLDGLPPPRGAVVDNGYALLETDDPGRTVRELVLAGVPLPELEVRPLTLAEALARIGGGG
jgi:ABC-2 type transport system ATP-binding protein